MTDFDAIRAAVDTAEANEQAALAALQTKIDQITAQDNADKAALASLQAAFDAYKASHPDPPPPVKTTLFGAFPGFSSPSDTSSYATRLARTTTAFGGTIGVERRFMGGSFTLPAMANPAILSYDFPVADTVAGKYNTQIDAIAKGATKTLFFVPWHEVENGPKLSPADYIKVFRYISDRVRAVGNPLVKMTTIMMGYSVRGGTRTTFDSYYPGDGYVDCIGFDTYVNTGVATLDTPEEMASAPIAIAADHHKPLVIGEVSFFQGSTYSEAQWADYVGKIIAAYDTPATAAVAWFETCKVESTGATVDFRITPHSAALSKWKTVASR